MTSKLSGHSAVGTAQHPSLPGTNLILRLEEALSHPPGVPGRLNIARTVCRRQEAVHICSSGGRRAPLSPELSSPSPQQKCGCRGLQVPYVPFFSPGSVGTSYSTTSLGVQALLDPAGAWRGAAEARVWDARSSVPRAGNQGQAAWPPDLALRGDPSLQRHLLLPLALLFGFMVPPGEGGPARR